MKWNESKKRKREKERERDQTKNDIELTTESTLIL